MGQYNGGGFAWTKHWECGNKASGAMKSCVEQKGCIWVFTKLNKLFCALLRHIRKVSSTHRNLGKSKVLGIINIVLYYHGRVSEGLSWISQPELWKKLEWCNSEASKCEAKNLWWGPPDSGSCWGVAVVGCCKDVIQKLLQFH